MDVVLRENLDGLLVTKVTINKTTMSWFIDEYGFLDTFITKTVDGKVVGMHYENTDDLDVLNYYLEEFTKLGNLDYLLKNHN